MSLILKEIENIIRDCESKKSIREAERIREERKAYKQIKDLMGVIVNEETADTVRQNT